MRFFTIIFPVSLLIMQTVDAQTDNNLDGRLFTTPAERAVLDELRNPPPAYTIVQPEIAGTAPEGETEEEIIVEPVIVPVITVNGIVKRSDGTSTAWINGMNTLDGDIDSQHIEVNSYRMQGEKVWIEVQDRPGSLGLKPGQSFDPDTGQTVDIYQQMTGSQEQSENP